MNYSFASELSTILYAIEQQNARLDLLLARHKKELINLNLYDKINGGFKLIDNGANQISEVF